MKNQYSQKKFLIVILCIKKTIIRLKGKKWQLQPGGLCSQSILRASLSSYINVAISFKEPADSSEQRHWRVAAFVITAYHLCGWKRKASTGVPPNHTHTHKSVHSSMFEPVFMECLLTPANSTLRTIGIFFRTSFLYSCINMLPQPLPSGNKTYYSYLQQKGCLIFFTQLLSALREQGAHRTHQDFLLLWTLKNKNYCWPLKNIRTKTVISPDF